MVRYTREHKDQTRQRILETAGSRLKRDGIDGSGVATLMSDAGLTNGAFYSHFESKDALVAAVVSSQLLALNARLEAEAGSGRRGLDQFVQWYLSREHCDDPGNGCPNAALLDEIGRSAAPVRDAYTEAMLVVVDSVAFLLPGDDSAARRLRALSLMGLLAGTLQLARAVTDRTLADAVLEQGQRDAQALLDSWHELDAVVER